MQSAGFVTRYVFIAFWLITAVILFFYMMKTPEAKTFWAFYYRWSILAYYFFILLIISLLLTPFCFSKYLKYLVLVPKILLDTFLVADYFVFKIYRFHIDMLFIKMAISDFKGIGLSPFFTLMSLLVFVVIAGLNILIFIKLRKKKIPCFKCLISVLLFFLLSGQTIHIWANYYKQHFIEQYTPYFPYYFPTTSHSLMQKTEQKFPSFIPAPVETAAQDLSIEGADSDALLHYPLKALRFSDTLQSKPNILIVVLESWRADKLNSLVMPHLDSLAQYSQRYNNHYSTGNVTVSGIFGLMYGLHPTYLTYVQADAYAHQTLLTKSLKDLGYDIKAYTSSNLNRFSLKPMLFNRIDKQHYYENLSDRADIADQKVVDKITADIQSENFAPWFKFVFLTSSHHHYFYPESYKKFIPLPENNEGFIFDKNIDPLPFINDYQNALLYEDALVNKIIQTLKSTGKLNNTLLIITGDHAEEFDDNKDAYWGHGSNFTRYQTQVPLLIYNPKDSIARQYDFPTAHIDIVPSLLKDYLACENAVEDFSSGINFKALQAHNRGFIQTSYKDKAYVIDSIVYSTGLLVKSYRIDDIKKTNKVYNVKRINILRKEETHFLK